MDYKIVFTKSILRLQRKNHVDIAGLKCSCWLVLKGLSHTYLSKGYYIKCTCRTLCELYSGSSLVYKSSLEANVLALSTFTLVKKYTFAL